MEPGATGVITHRVQEGKKVAYENWLNEIAAMCRSYPGHLDLQIVRPIEKLTSTYTIVMRFDTQEHLEKWLGSNDRRGFIEKAHPLLAQKDNFFIRSGLDFWFTPEGAKAEVPFRWKQLIITWTALYPVSIAIQIILIPVLRKIGVHQNRYIDTLFVSAVVVFIMVYFVMPRYTKLVKRWLFKGSK